MHGGKMAQRPKLGKPDAPNSPAGLGKVVVAAGAAAVL